MKDEKYIVEPIRRIVLPSDFSETANLAFAYALRTAIHSKAQLDLIHAGDDTAFPCVMALLQKWGFIEAGTSRSMAMKQLGICVRKIKADTVHHVKFTLNYMKKHEADLLVVAHHSVSDRKGFFGGTSSAEPLARNSNELALFIPDGCKGYVDVETGEISVQRILVPIDSKPNPQLAVNAAMRIARALDLEDIHFQLLHVGTGDAPRVDCVKERAGWVFNTLVLDGDPVEMISQVAEKTQPDLIVMATGGHNGFMDVIRGSVTERVCRELSLPLLAIPEHIHVL